MPALGSVDLVLLVGAAASAVLVVRSVLRVFGRWRRLRPGPAARRPGGPDR